MCRFIYLDLASTVGQFPLWEPADMQANLEDELVIHPELREKLEYFAHVYASNESELGSSEMWLAAIDEVGASLCNELSDDLPGVQFEYVPVMSS